VVRAASADFICVKFKMFASGKSLPRRFPSIQVPTLWFMDARQNDLGWLQGANPPDETAAKMKEMLDLWRSRRETVIWAASFTEGFEQAKNLVRPYLVVAYFPSEGGKATAAAVFQDPDVARASKRFACIDLDCEKDPKPAAWLEQTVGTRIWFLNPFDQQSIVLDGVPEKARLLESMDAAQKKFDEWHEKWKAGQKKPK